jgi:hypothetical protein
MISMQGRYSDPVGVLWGDKPLLATGILWLAGVVLIVAMGDHPTAGTPAGP